MDALILAGGLGTRLQAVLPQLPKALAPIQATPFLNFLLNQLAQWEEIERVILAVGHKASFILDYIKTLEYRFPILCTQENTPMGTGGALLHAMPLIQTATFLVMNGDSFSDLSLPSFLRFHQKHQGAASIACCEVQDASRYGSIAFNSTHQIVSFLEKSSCLGQGWVNAGMYLFEKQQLEVFPQGIRSLEKEIFPSLILQKMYAYPYRGTFIDIGTPDSFAEAQKILPYFAS